MILRADAYLQPGEAFHLARLTMTSTRPKRTHSHDFYEMFLIEAGRLHHDINGEMTLMDPGDIVFIRSDDTHALWSLRGSSARIFNLMFRRETIEALHDRYPEELGRKFFASPHFAPVQIRLTPPQLADALGGLMRLLAAPRTQMAIDGFLTQFHVGLGYSSRAFQDLPLWLSEGLGKADDPDLLRKGARGLALACGRSTEHVARTVRQTLGKTASEIMNEKRMVFASRLLLSTDQPIEKIGFACGFENQSYFFRLFKARYGVTPRQYRKEHFRIPVAPVR